MSNIYMEYLNKFDSYREYLEWLEKREDISCKNIEESHSKYLNNSSNRLKKNEAVKRIKLSDKTEKNPIVTNHDKKEEILNWLAGGVYISSMLFLFYDQNSFSIAIGTFLIDIIVFVFLGAIPHFFSNNLYEANNSIAYIPYIIVFFINMFMYNSFEFILGMGISSFLLLISLIYAFKRSKNNLYS